MPIERGRVATGNRNRRAAERKPSVSVVGAGRLGTALAIALASRGYRIRAVVARSARHARRAARITGAHPLALSAEQLDQLPPTDILFITTPDDEIGKTATRAAAVFRAGASAGRTALHASGALSSDALAPLRNAGFHTGSMHPLVAINEAVSGAESLRQAFFCVEGEPAAVRAARAVVRDLGARSFSVGAQDKALYHAAAVVSSGHVVALFDLATEMLVRCGLTQDQARRVLIPLLSSTIDNLSAREPSRALTGTFARADVATVRKHLGALRSQKMNDALAAYTLLGRRSLQLAEQNGAETEALSEIASILSGGKKSRR